MNPVGVTVEPFRLPLERDRFRDALAKGLGRAPIRSAHLGVATCGTLVANPLRAIGFAPDSKRNHASIADEGVVPVVAPWLKYIEYDFGDLR